MIEIKLNKFDIKKLNKHSTTIIIGQRAAGKTTLINNLTPNNESKTIILYGIDNYNYKNVYNEDNIYSEYSTEIIKDFIDKQKNEIIESKLNNFIISPACLVLDDCMSNKFTDKNLEFIFLNGRSYRMKLILSMQYPEKISPILRNNTDYVFIFKSKNKNHLKRIYQDYTGIFETYDIFYQVINSLNKYECLVINNTKNSNKIEDIVFWYKVDIKTKTFILSKL